MLQGLVVGIISLSSIFPVIPLVIFLFFLFVCAESCCAPSHWLTPSNSVAPAAKKLLVFKRDFPHLLCLYISSPSRTPPPASTSLFLSHTLILCPNFLSPPHSCLLFHSGFLSLFIIVLFIHSSCTSASCVVWFPSLSSVYFFSLNSKIERKSLFMSKRTFIAAVHLHASDRLHPLKLSHTGNPERLQGL